MSYHDARNPRQRKANADADFPRYDAAAHLDWLLSRPEFTALLALLRGEGMVSHREGLPFREYPINAIERPARVPVKRWHGTIRNRLERVLPPAFAGAVGLLVRNPNVALVIAPSRSLPSARVAQLQADCLRLLRAPYSHPARERRALDAARKRMKRALEAIDPASPLHSLVFYDGSLGLGIGSGVNVSATGYGAGSQMAVASAAQHPAVGKVVAFEGERLLVDPLRVPERISFYRGA